MKRVAKLKIRAPKHYFIAPPSTLSPSCRRDTSRCAVWKPRLQRALDSHRLLIAFSTETLLRQGSKIFPREGSGRSSDHILRFSVFNGVCCSLTSAWAEGQGKRERRTWTEGSEGKRQRVQASDLTHFCRRNVPGYVVSYHNKINIKQERGNGRGNKCTM